MIKKKSGGILGVIIAFMMVFTAMIPDNVMDAYAADDGIDVTINIEKNLQGRNIKNG